MEEKDRPSNPPGELQDLRQNIRDFEEWLRQSRQECDLLSRKLKTQEDELYKLRMQVISLTSTAKEKPSADEHSSTLGQLKQALDKVRQPAPATPDIPKGIAKEALPPPAPEPLRPAPSGAGLRLNTPLPSPRTPVPKAAPPGWKGALSQATRKEGGFEDFLGKKVLNKLGIVILVLGICFLIGYYVHHTGKWSKLLAGMVSGAGLIGIGIYLEKKDWLRPFVQPLIGGGWAILYFTAYAMYHIKAVQVLHNQTYALLILMAVAVGMILHSLRYKSQMLTSFAYLLAFATIWINEVTFHTLLAVLPLAASTLFIQIKLRWEVLPFISQLSSYALYALWATNHGAEIGSPNTPGPLFAGSLAVLTALWLVHVVPVYFTRETSPLCLFAQTTNVFLYPVLFGLQFHKVYPQHLYLFLFAFGVLQAVHCTLQKIRAVTKLYQLHVTAAVTLIALGLAYKFSESPLSWSWLIEAEAVLILGFLFKDDLLKHLAFGTWLACLGNLVHTASGHPQNILFLGREVTATLPFQIGLMVTGYINSGMCARAAGSKTGFVIENAYRGIYSWMGSFFLALAIWNALEVTAISAAWGLAALVLLELGFAFSYSHFKAQAHILAALSFGYLFFVDFGKESILGLSLKSAILLIVGTYQWYMYWREEDEGLDRPDPFSESVRSTRYLFAWLGLFAFGWLIQHEFDRTYRPAGWAVMAMALLILGRRRSKPMVQSQAIVMCIATLIDGFLLGQIDVQTQVDPISHRWVSFIISTLAFFAMGWMTRSTTSSSIDSFANPVRSSTVSSTQPEHGSASLQFLKTSNGASPASISEGLLTRAPFLYTFGATGLLAYLFWVEFGKYYLTVAWAAEGFVLVFLGLLLGQKILRYPGLVLLSVCVVKIAVVDLSKLEIPYRILSYMGLGILLIATSYLYFKFSKKLQDAIGGPTTTPESKP